MKLSTTFGSNEIIVSSRLGKLPYLSEPQFPKGAGFDDHTQL